MLRSRYKLNSVQFKSLYKNGAYMHTAFAMVKHAPSTDGQFRAAVVVSKKHAGNAIVRNRYRRLVYDAIRTYAYQNNLPPVHIIVQVKKQALTLDVGEFKLQLLDILKKVPTSHTINICKK